MAENWRARPYAEFDATGDKGRMELIAGDACQECGQVFASHPYDRQPSVRTDGRLCVGCTPVGLHGGPAQLGLGI